VGSSARMMEGPVDHVRGRLPTRFAGRRRVRWACVHADSRPTSVSDSLAAGNALGDGVPYRSAAVRRCAGRWPANRLKVWKTKPISLLRMRANWSSSAR